MKLRNTMLQTYGGFELDTSKIDCTHSLSKDTIELSYSGPLPAQFEGSTDIRLSFNVQAVQGANVLLKCTTDEGKKQKALVDATDNEIEKIIEQFFFVFDLKPNIGRTRFDCGLTRYWLGVWQTHFDEWRRTRTYYGAEMLIGRLEPAEREKLFARLQRTATA